MLYTVCLVFAWFGMFSMFAFVVYDSVVLLYDVRKVVIASCVSNVVHEKIHKSNHALRPTNGGQTYPL